VFYNSFVDPFKYYCKELSLGLQNFVDSGFLLFRFLETLEAQRREVILEGFVLKFKKVYNVGNTRDV
jgi:hypothetical protein